MKCGITNILETLWYIFDRTVRHGRPESEVSEPPALQDPGFVSSGVCLQNGGKSAMKLQVVSRPELEGVFEFSPDFGFVQVWDGTGGVVWTV